MYKSKMLKFVLLMMVVSIIASFNLVGCKEGEVIEETTEEETIEETAEDVKEEVVEEEATETQEESTTGLNDIEPPSESVELTMWMQDFEGGRENYGKYNDWLMEKYPNIKINMEFIAWADLGNKIIPSVMTGDEPDIIYGYSQWLLNNDIAELFMSLTPELGDSDMVIDEYLYRVFADIYEASDNELHVLPVAYSDDPGILINKQMADAAGVDISALTSWDSILDAAKKMTVYNDDGSIKVSGMNLQNYWNLSHYYISMVMQLGSEDYYDEGTMKWNFDSPEGKEAAEILYEFVEQDTYDPNSGTAQDSFPKRLTAMIPIGAWFANNTKVIDPTIDMEFIIIPRINSVDRFALGCCRVLTFSKRLEGDKKNAALLYAKHFLEGKFYELAGTTDLCLYSNEKFVNNWENGEYEGIYSEEDANVLQASIDNTKSVCPALEYVPSFTSVSGWNKAAGVAMDKLFKSNDQNPYSIDDFVKEFTDEMNRLEAESRL